MNILIIVFSFLVVLGLSTASFWQMTTTVRLETSSFCGYLAANRRAENAMQRKIFKKLPSAEATLSSRTEKGKSTSIKTSTYENPRTRAHLHHYANLELGALWLEDTHPYIEQVFLRLLHELYGHVTWFKQANGAGEVDALLTSLIRFGKTKKGKFALHEFISELPSGQAALFYKMLKGTHTYSLEDKKGYPPLLNFISLTSGSSKHTCRFSFASLPLLRALFDEETVAEILVIEKEKWEKDHKQHTCTKEELLDLLQFRPKSFTQPSMIETYFHFGKHAAPYQQVSGKDPSTKIHAERRLPHLL